jgi:hypothetical protein
LAQPGLNHRACGRHPYIYEAFWAPLAWLEIGGVLAFWGFLGSSGTRYVAALMLVVFSYSASLRLVHALVARRTSVLLIVSLRFASLPIVHAFDASTKCVHSRVLIWSVALSRSQARSGYIA